MRGLGIVLLGLVAASPVFGESAGKGVPLFTICTVGQKLTKKKEIVAYLKQQDYSLDDHTLGKHCTGNFMAWQRIKIRHRGNSSATFDKKQFQIKFRKKSDVNAKEKVSLLGMPAHDQWVFNAPYVDRTLMRNALVYRLGRMIGSLRGDENFAPRTHFAEVSVNDDYQGLFVVVEKIKRGKNRVDIPRIDINKPRNPHYLLEVAALEADFKTKNKTEIKWRYPSDNKLAEWKAKLPVAEYILRQKIKRDLADFEASLKSKNFRDVKTGYRQHIDLDSFIDFFLIQEVFKNVDGLRRSAYFHRNRASRLQMGPLWDFNMAAGNLRFYGMSKYSGWLHKKLFLIIRPAFWFKRMLKDPYFKAKMVERYRQLRSAGHPLHVDVMMAELAKLVAPIEVAAERDAARWKGTHNFFERVFMRTSRKGETFAENTQIMRDWLIGRLMWMDRELPQL